ncbi:MAG: hypothetical protein K9L82_15250 [Chromatiaceae bacterium]|nr:hypothetical protein [Chromatiaceae bacterium]
MNVVDQPSACAEPEKPLCLSADQRCASDIGPAERSHSRAKQGKSPDNSPAMMDYTFTPSIFTPSNFTTVIFAILNFAILIFAISPTELPYA